MKFPLKPLQYPTVLQPTEVRSRPRKSGSTAVDVDVGDDASQRAVPITFNGNRNNRRQFQRIETLESDDDNQNNQQV